MRKQKPTQEPGHNPAQEPAQEQGHVGTRANQRVQARPNQRGQSRGGSGVQARVQSRMGTRAVAGMAALALALAGCATGAGSADGAGNSGAGEGGVAVQSGGGGAGSGQTDPTGDLPVVVVSSFPLLYIAQQVGGDQVEILNLATTSGHAHDMELSPAQVNQLGGTDIALYLSEGFQPGVETAIQQSGVDSLDGFAVLEQSDTISGDPHVWMNPLNIARIGEELSTGLNAANPEAGAYYKENALALTEAMEQIDEEYARVLADCSGETLLTAHEAFGYLAARYGLDQVGVLGVDPEAEPSPARLLQVSNLIKERGIEVLFAEPAAAHGHDEGDGEDEHGHDGAAAQAGQSQEVSASSAKIAQTLGIPALALDPMEVQVDPKRNIPDVFASNLAALQSGLACAAK